jgi:hypothetical protein
MRGWGCSSPILLRTPTTSVPDASMEEIAAPKKWLQLYSAMSSCRRLGVETAASGVAIVVGSLAARLADTGKLAMEKRREVTQS